MVKDDGHVRGAVLIPSFTHSGVLPPFSGPNPTSAALNSPYKCTMMEFVTAFSGTAARKALLRGMLGYRDALRKAGFNSGFQWVNGSFVEDVESTRKRPPADIDLVTFASRPAAHAARAQWLPFVIANPTLFVPVQTKNLYFCDAYFVDLTRDPTYVAEQSAYWCSLFSHRRSSGLWKGMVSIPLLSDDIQAAALVP